jgi:hypothetical protein
VLKAQAAAQGAGKNPTQSPSQVALAERHAQRLRHMGPQWAQAFFKAEDQRFEALLRSEPTAAGAEPSLPLEGMLTPEQLQRWRQGQVEQALWEDHLRDVQEHWQGLLARKELSEAQRSQELTRFMSGFMDAEDQRRTRMLLDLPQ